jgi:hypothetical protein
MCIKLLELSIDYTKYSARPKSSYTIKIRLTEPVNYIQNVLTSQAGFNF